MEMRRAARVNVLVVVAILLAAVLLYVQRPPSFLRWMCLTPLGETASQSERFAPPKTLWSVPPATSADLPGRGRKVVITGGAGFIGSQLGWFLHNEGFDVVLIDNMKFGYQDNLIVDGKKFGTVVVADVLDAKRLVPFIENAFVMFHFAALSALPVCQSRPQEAMEVNVGGTAAMLEMARLHNVERFIFASTSATYENTAPNDEGRLSENATVDPHLIYSLTKLQGEELVRAMAKSYNMDTVILRFFNVYGPHQDFRRLSPPFTSYIVRELIAGHRAILHSNGLQRRDYVHVDDLMRLCVLTMTSTKAVGYTFNVASGESYSVNEMYEIVAKYVNRTDVVPEYHSAERFWDAYPELFQGRRPIDKKILIKEVNKNSRGDNSRAADRLGWVPRVTMQKGLHGLVDYMREALRALRTNGDTDLKTAWV